MLERDWDRDGGAGRRNNGMGGGVGESRERGEGDYIWAMIPSQNNCVCMDSTGSIMRSPGRADLAQV